MTPPPGAVLGGRPGVGTSTPRALTVVDGGGARSESATYFLRFPRLPRMYVIQALVPGFGFRPARGAARFLRAELLAARFFRRFFRRAGAARPSDAACANVDVAAAGRKLMREPR